MKVAFANDHAAMTMRDVLLKELKARGIEVLDFGNATGESTDYPDHARLACEAVARGGPTGPCSLAGQGSASRSPPTR